MKYILVEQIPKKSEFEKINKMLKIISYLSLFVLLIVTTSTLARVLPSNANYDLSEAELEVYQSEYSGKYHWTLTKIKTETSNRKYTLRCYILPRANYLMQLENNMLR